MRLWLTQKCVDSMRYDIALVSDAGKRLCSLHGLEVARHHINPVANVSRPLELVLQPAFMSARPRRHSAASLETRGKGRRVFEILNGMGPFAQPETGAVLDRSVNNPLCRGLLVSLRSSCDIERQNKLPKRWSSHMQTLSLKQENVCALSD